MRKLIIIHPHYTLRGGAGNFILEIGKRLTNKFEVVTISQQSSKEYEQNFPEINFESLNGPKTDSFNFWLLFPYWQFKTYLRLKKHIRPNTTVLVNVFPSNWLVLPLKIFFRKTKFIWFCHEPSPFVHTDRWKLAINDPFKRYLAKVLSPLFSVFDIFVTKLADDLFVNSEFGNTLCYQIYKKHGQVIYPGVETTFFKPIKFHKKENLILTVSKLSKFKNVDILIKSFKIFSNKHPDYKLIVIGDGEEKDNLNKLIYSLEIDNKAQILSGVDDINKAKYCSKAKIFVLCSKNEPFGMVATEAMSSGTPVIADNSGGPKEIIDNKINGVLINRMTTYKLSVVLDNLIKDEITLKDYSRKCRNKVENKFSWDVSTNKIEKYL